MIDHLNNVKFVPKSKSWLMRALASVFPRTRDCWTTYRLPGGKAVIAHPDYVVDPLAHRRIIEHELVHVKQQASFWGLLKSAIFATVFPLPVFFSGRWFIERDAYLQEIKNLGGTDIAINAAVDTLWDGYLWPWPRKLMYAWFKEQLKSGTQGSV